MKRTSIELWIVIIVLGLIVCLLALFTIVPARPTGYTELYFSEEPMLGNGTMTLAFVINNLEGTNLRYTYNIYISSIPTVSQKITVKNKEKEEVRAEIALTAIELPLKVSVQTEENEIHYWIK